MTSRLAILTTIVLGLMGSHLLGTRQAVGASSYRVEYLDPAPDVIVPWDINDAGVVAAGCGTADRACLVDGTGVRDIHPAGSTGRPGLARAVNASGHAIVVVQAGPARSQIWVSDGVDAVMVHPTGTCLSLNDDDVAVGSDWLGQPWSWSPSGGLVDLAPAVGWPVTDLRSINVEGMFAGTARNAAGTERILFYHDGSTLHPITLGLPFIGPGTQVFQMNRVGQFVGEISADGPDHAFVYDMRTDTGRDLHPTSGPLSQFTKTVGMDINDGGQIVGFAARPVTGGGTHALLIENGRLTDLHEFMPDGIQESSAAAINNAGVIVGWANRGFSLWGFLLTPVAVDASVHVTPHALNMGILLGGLTARLQVAPDFRSRVDLDSLELRSVGGVRPPGGGIRPASIGQPGSGAFHLTFERRDLEPALEAVRAQIGSDVTFTLAGRLDDGTLFLASDVIRIVGLDIPTHAPRGRRVRP